MGMNYYTGGTKKVACEHCSIEHLCSSNIHIGKSSFGWKFAFAWNDGEYYKNIDELKKWLANKTIVDEAGAVVSHTDFWAKVDAKQQEPRPNRSIRGENHGEYDMFIGEYNFIKGEFS